MTKEVECKVFNRPEYCLQIHTDCIHCNKQIGKDIDCQGMNSTDNYCIEEEE